MEVTLNLVLIPQLAAVAVAVFMVKIIRVVAGWPVTMAVQAAAALLIGIVKAAQVLQVKVAMEVVAPMSGPTTKQITSNVVMATGKLAVVVVRVDRLQRLLQQHILVKVATTTHGVSRR